MVEVFDSSFKDIMFLAKLTEVFPNILAVILRRIQLLLQLGLLAPQLRNQTSTIINLPNQQIILVRLIKEPLLHFIDPHFSFLQLISELWILSVHFFDLKHGIILLNTQQRMSFRELSKSFLCVLTEGALRGKCFIGWGKVVGQLTNFLWLGYNGAL